MFLTKSAVHGIELCCIISPTGDLGGILEKKNQFLFTFICFFTMDK